MIKIYFQMKKKNEDKEKIHTKFSLFSEFEVFLKDTLGSTTLNEEFKSLSKELLNHKIRISLFGNICVGKSSILNAIIGENILPTSSEICSRPIIIRYADEDIFKLYKTKLIIDGKGNDDNYYFEDDIDICCYGVQNIKTYLKNIINKIEDKNIFFVISGRLKIFDFIKVNNDIIPKIEFIDLPEFDNRSKDF